MRKADVLYVDDILGLYYAQCVPNIIRIKIGFADNLLNGQSQMLPVCIIFLYSTFFVLTSSS